MRARPIATKGGTALRRMNTIMDASGGTNGRPDPSEVHKIRDDRSTPSRSAGGAAQGDSSSVARRKPRVRTRPLLCEFRESVAFADNVDGRPRGGLLVVEKETGVERIQIDDAGREVALLLRIRMAHDELAERGCAVRLVHSTATAHGT